MTVWLGVDVGGVRKGFDAAVVDDHALVALHGRLSRAEVVELAAAHQPEVIGIDSPRECAPAGELTRPAERALRRAVCGIRWTPDAERVADGGDYYEWVREGLALYGALTDAGHEPVEVFPTASWTRWCGPRGHRARGEWSRRGLATLGLTGMPAATNQDQRDAIAAAVTARQHAQGRSEVIGGKIVVPAVAL